MAEHTRMSDARWLLAPGTLCTSGVFDPLLMCLGIDRERRCDLTLNKPGVDDYADRLRAEIKPGDIACGFSLGAIVLSHNLGALREAGAILLLACNPFPDPAGNRANRVAIRNRVLDGDAKGWVRDNWSIMAKDGSPELMNQVAAMAERSGELISAQTELASSRPGAAQQIIDSGVPIVFVTGSADRLTPPERLQPLVEQGANVHQVVLDGLGHFALMEAPGVVAEAIEEVIGSALLHIKPHQSSERVTHG